MMIFHCWIAGIPEFGVVSDGQRRCCGGRDL